MAQIKQGTYRKNVDTSEPGLWGRFRDFVSEGGGQAAGGIIGTVTGGPMGGMTGAGIGGQAGSMFRREVDLPQSVQVQGVQATDSDSAISRRLAASREDRLAALNRAQSALGSLPKDMREEYAPVLVQATMAEEKRRAMGVR
jgi:hypothetical protein